MTPTSTIPVTSDDIARLRLHALALHRPNDSSPPSTPLEVVRHHLAMQAQDWGASQWAVGSRLPGSTRADVCGAYDRGEIVRSWPMRGTVHAVAADDLHWMLDLMGIRALAGVHRRWKVLGIDEPWLERARDAACSLLRGGRSCTRSELCAALSDSGLEVTGQRAYHTVWYLSQTGTLCQGPTRDGEQLLVLLDEWIPHPRTLSRHEALAELGRRYISSHGPATADDLAHWTKLTKGDCRSAIEANRDDLVELDRDGVRYVAMRTLVEQLEARDATFRDSVHALAPFDEHLLGYRDRIDVLDPAHATRVDPGRNGVFRSTIVRGGRVVATWARKRRTRSILVTLDPLERLRVADRPRIVRALDRYGHFVGMPVELAF